MSDTPRTLPSTARNALQSFGADWPEWARVAVNDVIDQAAEAAATSSPAGNGEPTGLRDALAAALQGLPAVGIDGDEAHWAEAILAGPFGDLIRGDEPGGEWLCAGCRRLVTFDHDCAVIEGTRDAAPGLREALTRRVEDARQRQDDAQARRLPGEEGRSIEERLWANRARAFEDAIAIVDRLTPPSEAPSGGLDRSRVPAFVKRVLAEVPLCTGCDFDHGWDDHVLAVFDATLGERETLVLNRLAPTPGQGDSDE